jgi:hypothetical protein
MLYLQRPKRQLISYGHEIININRHTKYNKHQPELGGVLKSNEESTLNAPYSNPLIE